MKPVKRDSGREKKMKKTALINVIMIGVLVVNMVTILTIDIIKYHWNLTVAIILTYLLYKEMRR